MKYYQVKKDNYYIINKKTKKLFCLVQNELFTETEVKKLIDNYYISKEMKNNIFNIININKNNTFFFFGARLSTKKA